MTDLAVRAPLALATHNPDVLTCIANLSNDEVFTPPEFANRMLDTLAEAWAQSHDGASIWADSGVTFLDPFTKSGVFLREITARLTEGLAEEIPDLRERVDHILTKQVYGIGITQLTALLARRSVYCSKDATGEHSIARSFDRDWGNIWFERTEHTWAGTKCAYCGAPRDQFDRDEDLEAHAYAFIHTTDITARLARMFGADVHFDVIIGNPPYQMAGGAGGSSDSSIYHLFAEQAMLMEPRFLSMVIPSRWLAGGRGLDEFRRTMLHGAHLRELVDFEVMSEAFPGVDFEGGVCYFLWDPSYQGDTRSTVVRGDRSLTAVRDLGEFDVFVRDPRAAEILKKVRAHGEASITSIVAKDTPFGFATNYTGYRSEPAPGDVPIHFTKLGKRGVGYVSRAEVAKNAQLIDTWKVLVPEAFGERGAVPARVLGMPLIASAPSTCTQSFLFLHVATQAEAESVQSYYATKFFRFLVSLRKITQHALHSTYSWVPMQTWDRAWEDRSLFDKYGLTSAEIEYIDAVIKPMDLTDA